MQEYTLNDIREALIDMRLEANPEYNPDKDSGLIGDTLEVAVKLFFNKSNPWQVSKQGRSDVRINGRNVEVKQGGGELGLAGGRLIRGSGLVLYVPVVLIEYPLTMQEGYVMDRADFLEALDEANALRRKANRTPCGGEKVTIQTFWNRKENKPHGRLLDRMLEAFDNHEAQALEDFLEENRK